MKGLTDMVALVVGLVLGLALVAGDAAAEAVKAAQPPSCTRETLGISACFGPRLCACIHDRGGAASGVPAGYRWDCGILRPRCDPAGPPATLDPFRGPFPHAVGIDRSDRRVIVDQDTRTIIRVPDPSGGADPPAGGD
ncbi:MAG: hypothetical protein EA406_11900 [Rhodospirillales bacterium]|nr:MAG: hypothetical protein EA406_11900 [Rhodospirillales bacterium]